MYCLMLQETKLIIYIIFVKLTLFVIDQTIFQHYQKTFYDNKENV